MSSEINRIIIDRYMLKLPIDINAIGAGLGISIKYDNSLPSTISGKIVRESVGSPAGYTIYINSNHSKNRQRFTLAHEIGHYILHRDILESGLIEDSNFCTGFNSKFEKEAHRWAIDLIMPSQWILGLYHGGTKDLEVIAKMLDVPVDAVVMRLTELGLI